LLSPPLQITVCQQQILQSVHIGILMLLHITHHDMLKTVAPTNKFWVFLLYVFLHCAL